MGGVSTRAAKLRGSSLGEIELVAQDSPRVPLVRTYAGEKRCELLGRGAGLTRAGVSLGIGPGNAGQAMQQTRAFPIQVGEPLSARERSSDKGGL